MGRHRLASGRSAHMISPPECSSQNSWSTNMATAWARVNRSQSAAGMYWRMTALGPEVDQPCALPAQGHVLKVDLVQAGFDTPKFPMKLAW